MTRENQTRCENCGRKRPCEPCAARARQALEDALVDRMSEMVHDAQPLMLWFDLPLDQARQHCNRLHAEWPGALHVVEPEEPGDMLYCYVALNEEDLTKNPQAEWEVTETRVRRVDNEEFLRALRALGPPPW